MASIKSTKILVPPQEERPKLGQVGIIAGVCFAIGVIWPTLAGVKLVPSVPGSEQRVAPSAEPKPERPAEPDVPGKEVPVSAAAPLAALGDGRSAVAGPSAQIEKTLVVNCRDDKDRKLAQCDTPGFDAVAGDRLKALTACEAASGASGLLSIGFELDFGKGKIEDILLGKSSTLDDATAEALLACAKREFMTASLKDLAHSHSHYLIFYMVKFSQASLAAADGPQEADVEATGTATIIWNSAQVRAEPVEDGTLKTRLLYGTKVVVAARRGDWYKIRYDARGSEGWVHKNALAM